MAGEAVLESWTESQSGSGGSRPGLHSCWGKAWGLEWQGAWHSFEQISLMVFGPPAFSGAGSGEGQPTWVLGQAECYLSRGQY